MVKKSKPSMPLKNEAKERWEYYRALGSWKEVPYSMESLKRLAGELYTWATTNEDALVLEEFHLSRGISTSTWQDFVKRCPELQQAKYESLRFIGIRREKGAIKNKYNERAVDRMQPRYNRALKKMDEWRANLRAKANEDNQKQGNVTVVIEKYQDKQESS